MELFDFDTDKEWDYENGFYLTSDIRRIPKLLAHYELYKMITDLPGHIVECGVYKGASLIRFATFREVLESPFSRKIIGFDAFGKFPAQIDHNDAEFIANFENMGGDGISSDELDAVFRYKKFRNYELVEGDVKQTIPKYLIENPELKIALLHIDVDVYEPSRVALENLFDKVVAGGLIVLDDYGTVSGETQAVDEFLAGKTIRVRKLSMSHIPAYIVKE